MAERSVQWLRNFVKESNRVEGILRLPTKAEVEATVDFLTLHQVSVAALVDFVSICQPGAVLRDCAGLNVRVGSHRPPPGGPDVAFSLVSLCDGANAGLHPYELHHAYETLHPFTDGNGRSGRVLWLWGMRRRGGDEYERAMALGFLHCWYYQSLEAGPYRTAFAPQEGEP